MGRKIISKRIEDERKRKVCLKKRRRVLLHKLKELSILCDVKAAAIIYSPGEDRPIIWPSHQVVLERIAEYKRCKEACKTLKMEDRVSYLLNRVRKEAIMIKRLKKKNDEKEMKFLINQIIYKGMDVTKLDTDKLKALLAFSKHYLKDLKKRVEYLRSNYQENGKDKVAPRQNGMVSEWQCEGGGMIISPTSVDQMMENKLSPEAKNVEGLDFCWGAGASSMSDHLENSSANINRYGGNDDIELPNDLNEAFPSIFS